MPDKDCPASLYKIDLLSPLALTFLHGVLACLLIYLFPSVFVRDLMLCSLALNFLGSMSDLYAFYKLKGFDNSWMVTYNIEHIIIYKKA